MKDFYFYSCYCGGGVGGIAGMYAFRHKTKKWYFKYGFPTILIVEIAVAVYLKLAYFM